MHPLRRDWLKAREDNKRETRDYAARLYYLLSFLAIRVLSFITIFCICARFKNQKFPALLRRKILHGMIILYFGCNSNIYVFLRFRLVKTRQ